MIPYMIEEIQPTEPMKNHKRASSGRYNGQTPLSQCHSSHHSMQHSANLQRVNSSARNITAQRPLQCSPAVNLTSKTEKEQRAQVLRLLIIHRMNGCWSQGPTNVEQPICTLLNFLSQNQSSWKQTYDKYTSVFYSVLWFKPSWKLGPMQPLPFSHPLGDTNKG